ncbi:TPA: phage holin, lambda family [Mannheimia haemolytica]|nr:phage holin, lambda family [Mannheimia haemolytica]MDW0536478.1 phage holin, lambda family [Mannheimia haemolytica]MDW0539096.1 phage holin, lambda family [Mannheimia haemolytica]MDW0546851.1 phage holin, lambda family [Mannheimia haemolytica]MDW0573290.1 phage holin, lambda family [Mannheimia haemolytica]MDW0575860.1 phage holin, lambda family [Mannheimia haemolytica]
MKMPDKDPNVWLVISAYIQQNYNAITGFVMAFFMSMLRAWFLQQKSTYRQRFLDGAICGALTLSCMSLLTHFGVGESLSTFAGGMIGFVGAEKIREFLFALIRKKIEVNDVGFNRKSDE